MGWRGGVEVVHVKVVHVAVINLEIFTLQSCNNKLWLNTESIFAPLSCIQLFYKVTVLL